MVAISVLGFDFSLGLKLDLNLGGQIFEIAITHSILKLGS